MILSRLKVGPIQTNCYVVKSDTSDVGFVVDPGASADKILEEVDKLGVRVKYVVLTHGHFDHTFAAKEVAEHTGAALVLHADDGKLMEDGGGIGRHVYPSRIREIMARVYLPPDIVVHEGDELEAGDMTLRFLHTPGHTMGSMIVLCEDVAFTGDTVLEHVVGRTDFHESNPFAMEESLRKVARLEGDYRLCPGHGDFSTLEYEKRNNPYLKDIRI